MSKNPFYLEPFDTSFRFGDVLKGFVVSTPNFSNPPLTNENMNFNIEVSLPSYCVVLSPCCSISDKTIALSPLIKLYPTFFKNEYFTEDLTRVNRLVPPEKTMPSYAWEKLSLEKKQEILDKGEGYTFLDLFIYKEHDLFPKYEISRKSEDNIFTKYYMIDFRNIFRVNSSSIKNPNVVPIESKCLQLTIETRTDLRLKITKYFSRIPDEDITGD